MWAPGNLIGHAVDARCESKAAAEQFQRELLARLCAPAPARPADAAALDAAFVALSLLNPAWISVDGVEALLQIVSRHYAGANEQAALAPAAAAVAAARTADSRPLLRRALSYCGGMNAETGNLPVAVANYMEALDVAAELGDSASEANVWNNLGLALVYASQYADGIRCFEHALALDTDASTRRRLAGAANANIAMASLRIHDVRRGLLAARESVKELDDPGDDLQRVARVTSEKQFVDLLLEVGDTEAALERTKLARQVVARAASPRADVYVALIEARVEIARGTVDIGLSRLKNALQKARSLSKALFTEALRTAVKGYEQAGQPDVALVYLNELLELNRQAKQQQVLLHHQRHLEQVERSQISIDVLQSAENNLNSQRLQLRGKLGSRELMKQRVSMLEQHSVAAELHDDTTGEHCYRVGRLASILAREYGLEDDVCFMIDLAARMHDIGKLAVPDTILLKPGRLTDGERLIMQQHTIAGANILARSQIPQMHVAEEIARHHHEWFNGSGYPHRLAGDSIPIAARITAIVDVFDALTHVRPYKPAWTVPQAMHEIRTLKGSQFDPDVTDLFLKLIPRLQREVGDLDEFLGAEARHSPFIQARARIAEHLKGGDGNGIGTLLDLRR